MRDISYSTAGFKDRDFPEALAAVAAAGFECFELVAMDPHVPVALAGAKLAALRNTIQASGLTARTMHGTYATSALGWIAERQQQRDVEPCWPIQKRPSGRRKEFGQRLA
ncbi:MAG: sugar phosphate isomerase/epimerase [Hyphomicrobiaceae bacterium]|jgi:sugar phosphate isomerase/epimerase